MAKLWTRFGTFFIVVNGQILKKQSCHLATLLSCQKNAKVSQAKWVYWQASEQQQQKKKIDKQEGEEEELDLSTEVFSPIFNLNIFVYWLNGVFLWTTELKGEQIDYWPWLLAVHRDLSVCLLWPKASNCTAMLLQMRANYNTITRL